MLIKILRTGVERHCERELGTILVESGLAEEVIRAGTPKEPTEVCALIWTVGHTPHSNLPCLSARCTVCKMDSHYTVDPLEPRRVRSGGGVARFAVWHRGRREHAPAWALEQLAALGIPNAETLGAGTPPVEFMQSSGDLMRDLLTVQTGRRPADPTPGPVANEIIAAKGAA